MENTILNLSYYETDYFIIKRINCYYKIKRFISLDNTRNFTILRNAHIDFVVDNLIFIIKNIHYFIELTQCLYIKKHTQYLIYY